MLGCLGLVGCTDEDRDSNGVPFLKAIALEPESLQVTVGSMATLSVKGIYSDGTTKAIASDLVTWESDDDANITFQYLAVCPALYIAL